MIAIRQAADMEEFVVIHPLFDAPEAKCDPSSLGPMKLNFGSRFLLLTLRAYLIAMGALLAYHTIASAGLFPGGAGR